MDAEFPKLTGREWLAALCVAVVAVGLLQIPYALGYALARPGTEFTGVIMNPEDSQSYFAKMLEGYDGNWLYTIPFTTEEHSPEFVGGFYLLLGHLARFLNLPLVAVWHLARIAADVIMFLAAFGFVATFLREPRTRWTAYLLAVFGAGLGWLLFLLNQPYWLGWFPVDFKMPEAHLFFIALTFPHVALGTAVILGSFWLTLQSFAPSGKWLYAGGAGLVNLALAIVYPFLIYLVVATLGLYWIYLAVRERRVMWREARRTAIAFLVPAPLVFYYAITLATNPVFRAWDAQSITLSPPLPHYLVAYGIMLALALLSLRRFRDDAAFLWTWLVAVAVLVYAPLNPQRRFVEGVQVPLAILAAVGLCEVVLPWLSQTREFRALASLPRYSVAGIESLLIVAFLLFSSLSNVYIIASVSVTAAFQQPFPLFRSHDEITAVDWLRANTARSDVILGAYETGNYIAAHAGNRVVVGHWAETVDWQRKFNEVGAFYGTLSGNALHRGLLKRYGVQYVWFGATEHELGEYDPAASPYLQLVFSNDAVQIYRVETP
jgi:hypothetical protein